MKKFKNMSPLIIVGILFISTALADVSHVLSGQAHPPVHPVDVNSLSAPRNAFQSGNPNDFWWMASNSPLKEAYDYYKKCTSKGDCLPSISVVPGVKVAEAHFDPIDLKKNPFLNGEFQSGVVTSSSSFASSSSGCSGCASGSKTGGIAAFHTGTKIDITNNPFLSGKFATAGNGDKVKDENGFIGVQPKQPGFAVSHPLSNKKPFATSSPNVPQSFVLGGDGRGVQCTGQGYLCVAKHLCVDGVFTRAEELHQARNEIQYCNADIEVCCRLGKSSGNAALPNTSGKTTLAGNINDLVDITAGKSSVTGSSYKFSGGAGSSSGQIQVIIDDPAAVKAQVYHNGESGSQPSTSTNKATRDVTPSAGSVFPSTIDYSDVQISNDIRFASTIKGPAYLPPIGPGQPSTTPELAIPTHPSIITYQPSVPTTPRPVPTTGPACPFGTILTPFGTCETPSTPIPQCPFGTIRTPSGNCETPVISTTPKSCPFGTISTPDGSCVRPSPPPSPLPSPRPCPPGTFLRPSGLCEAPASSCPPGSIQRPDGSCEKIPPSPLPKVCTYGTLPDGSCIRPTSPPPSPRPCPPGTFLTASGICETPRPSTTPPPCPPGTILTPSGLCEAIRTPIPRPICPPGTIQKASGICEQPVPITSSTTPGYDYSPSPCPPGTFRAPTGLCETLTVTTARPQCPPGTYLTISGSCETPRPSTPKPPPRPFDTTSREYLPPVTPTQPSPSPTSGYHYETPTPPFSYPSSTLIPNSNSINNQFVPAPTTPQYLPPYDKEGSTIRSELLPDRPDNKGEPGNTINVSIPPSRPPPSRQPPTRQPPIRPPPFRQDQNNEPPVGCAAALKCVQEIYCTAEGVVSPVPVVLTKDQELLRVPTTECKEEETGIIGKCCRDPNYKDPWPSANLVNGVDDGQYKEDNLYGQRQQILSTNRLTRSSNSTRTNVRRNVEVSHEHQPSCGERHKNTNPPGSGPIDANFAEYPWQAMILRDSNRSLLCGGAIIRRDAVLTAAHCVEGLETSDVLIKGGEWKLGIDEEPLPFQIVKVGAILRHPDYVPGSYKNDLAVLVLREKLRPSKNVGTICLPEANQVPTTNCVATGWGKRILQLHAKGAIMHHIDVNVLDSQTCQEELQQNFQHSVESYGPRTLCGRSDIDHCKVDYGSALACPNSQGHYTLTGIYAWDTGCKEERQIGGYVAPDVEWIEYTLAKSIKELKKIEREYLLKASK